MKRRLNLIISKKQIIIASLTVLLGAAIYVNYLYSSANNDLTASNDLTGNKTNYGDVQFVSGNADTNALNADSEKDTAVTDVASSDQSDTYFVQARLDKQQSRDEAIEVLQSMYVGGDLNSDELAVVAQDAVGLSGLIESEAKIENLLKAQGFSDALCYLNGTSANIIVKTNGLDSVQAAQIKSTLLSEVAVSSDNITIVEVN